MAVFVASVVRYLLWNEVELREVALTSTTKDMTKQTKRAARFSQERITVWHAVDREQ
jgi:DNA-binding protein